VLRAIAPLRPLDAPAPRVSVSRLPLAAGQNHFAHAFLPIFSGDRRVDDVVKQTPASDDPPDADDFFVAWKANRVSGDYT